MTRYRNKVRSCGDTQKFKIINTRIKKKIRKYLCQKEKMLLKTKNRTGIFNHIAHYLKEESLPGTFKLDDKILIADEDKSKAFADYFHSTFPNSSSNFTTNNSDNHHSIPYITPPLVFDCLRKTKSSINTSPDNIPYLLYKKCAISLAEPISKIFNYSFHHGIVPDLWKTAIIKPVFKKGDKSNIKNYRPISLTCSLSKICERVVKFHLLNILNASKIIPSCQHGF